MVSWSVRYKKVLFSLLVIGVVAAVAGAGTMAFFSDTETSTGNTFTAGTLDLKVDWIESYNGEIIETQDETDDPGAIFELDDVKPGDSGEATISLHVYENDAYALMILTPTSNDDVSSTEPELEAGDAQEDQNDDWDGELAQNMNIVIWWDDGDNVLEEGEPVLYDRTGPLKEVTIILDADPSTPEID